MAGLQTQFSFTLPKGFVDESGMLHRHGTMRLATARDEIEPLRSGDIDGPDDPYLTILVLARVITELGSLAEISTDEVERLFAADLAFLQDLYGIINFGDPADVAALQATVSEPAPWPALDERDVNGQAETSTDDVDGSDMYSGDMETSGPPTSMRSRERIEEVTRPAGP